MPPLRNLDWKPLDVRKARAGPILANAGSGLRRNEHLEHDDGELVFRHACKRGLEGIVSKHLRSGYRSGLSPDWLKEETCGARREAGGGGALGMSYWSTTSTFTLTSDTPPILTVVPETWMVNSS
jgi:hypothetical protein